MAITMKKINPVRVTFWIKGTSPLIQHKWSEKALDMMRMTAAERKKVPKKARNQQEEGAAAMYLTDQGEPGIPLTAFKSALIGAAHKDFGIEKTLVRKAFFIPSTDSNSVVPMECSEPHIREDIVRVGANQTDIRYRPQFDHWRVKITAEVDKELMSSNDIVNLVNRAGFSVGIGEWRPEKGGEYGRFTFDASEALEEEVIK